ncbi:PREDICTED: uncharacterized protein At4g04775-like [Erythranthe guttata]|uniref:uncharacterized protein At4g04775-like n=1 Tax=Erythranthe guttata TaxID=4155 RepID=UPI00064DA79F|nr:PREDICTED: uncharacterized protein At4g04775-like [Erythranthe guttata]|eukprot:XP_012829795.1 PREDICTED: uncharacterized protein At4g04775-like [Erythranthe guttata]
MSQNSGSSYNSRSARNEVFYCKCGDEMPLLTSWTPSNPGRRFRACPNYERVKNCDVFKWHDPEMCARSKNIIPGLIRRIDRLNDELASYKEKRDIRANDEDMMANEEAMMAKQEDMMAKEKKSYERKIKKMENLIVMYNNRMKILKVLLIVLGCLIVIVMMKISG